MKPKLIQIFILSVVIIGIIALAQCTDQEKKDIRGPEFASDKTCVKCHSVIAKSYVHTAHFNSSSPVNPNLANYDKNGEEVTYRNGETITIEKRKDSLFQVLENAGQTSAYPLQIAFGSGEKAQTFGYWQNNKLFQLPLTFIATGSKWVNSPGFNVDHPYFGRAIVTRCFECHSSHIDADVKFVGFQKEETLKPASILYGIDCQRCHGPAANHVNFHTATPNVKEARYMAKYKELSRSQKVDMCGVCHSGNDQTAIKSTFSFTPGDTLSNFFYQDFGALPSPDVHGKQVQQLKRSECYKNSASLDCTSCHNVHQPKQKMVFYNQKCVSCHQNVQHQKALSTSNCVECHMPAIASSVIKFESAKANDAESYRLRTHIIKVYSNN